MICSVDETACDGLEYASIERPTRGRSEWRELPSYKTSWRKRERKEEGGGEMRGNEPNLTFDIYLSI